MKRFMNQNKEPKRDELAEEIEREFKEEQTPQEETMEEPNEEFASVVHEKEEPPIEEEPQLADESKLYKGADGTLYTEAEWTAPVVQNGPSRQEVEEWKEKHGEVYFTPMGSTVYFWRTLTRPEYRETIRDQSLTALDREEIWTEKCVLFPRNFTMEKIKNGRAGDPSLLSEMIMDKSGFVAQSAPIKI